MIAKERFLAKQIFNKTENLSKQGFQKLHNTNRTRFEKFQGSAMPLGRHSYSTWVRKHRKSKEAIKSARQPSSGTPFQTPVSLLPNPASKIEFPQEDRDQQEKFDILADKSDNSTATLPAAATSSKSKAKIPVSGRRSSQKEDRSDPEKCRVIIKKMDRDRADN